MSKPRVNTSTTAVVTLTIELTGLGSWGPDCKTSQVYDQAKEAALGRLRRLFQGDPNGVRVVGAVKVKSVTTDTEAR
ncbi:hypothetical protein [Bowmanella yangjiangensis]|uniref:Uncharacterized protein n=1 Tax=Bowmanella yangjiangensis TaxID=2811230 RepID=A0ABS3CZ34_9ALTE|nr:hypothetical protein [Bowmanella yangjiangensis]MBN7822348.1 hypothetical protein [Bowmanella yangjiangensis]